MRTAALLATAAAVVVIFAGPAAAGVPEGYPADYGAVIDAAVKEGRVVVYSTTDSAQAASLIKDFEATFPGIKVEYSDLNSTELYNRLIAEAAAGQGTADVTWSSAPDLQVKLAADGYAASYTSPEVGKLPAWANYRNTVYGVTADPITIVYNKRATPEGDVPADHEALLKLLTEKTEAYRGKVAAYDPERSGVGFYFMTQDEIQWKAAPELFKAFGKVGLKTYTSAGAMIEKVTAGEHLMAYGIFGSYAVSRNAKDPNLGIVYPKDYTLVTTRAVFVPEKAKNPAAGRLFLDYLLSKRGQTLIAGDAKLFAVRGDVEGATTMATIRAAGAATVKAIALDDALLDGLDQTKRLRFLKDWGKAMKGQ